MTKPLKAWISNKACLVTPKGTVLFVRDSGTEQDHAATAGWWDLPGGRMDDGDKDFEQALRRELVEEIGYALSEEARPNIFSRQFWQKPDGNYILVNFFHVPVDAEFDPQLSDEHTEFVWETVTTQLPQMDVNDHEYRAALKDYIAKYE